MKHVLDLAQLRRRLATECGLEAFKMPTLLKVVGSLDDIPMTVAEKPIKHSIRGLYFSEAAVGSGEVEVWDENKASDIEDGPFDWDGLQR